MNVAGLVIAAVALEAAAIVAWPMRHPVTALILLGAYVLVQIIPLLPPPSPHSGWRPPGKKRRSAE